MRSSRLLTGAMVLGVACSPLLVPTCSKPQRKARHTLVDRSLTIVPADTFRVIADLDRDGVVDTFGYRRGRPWHRVYAWFSASDTSWSAQPGAGLDEIFAPLNSRIRAGCYASFEDSAKARECFERRRVCADNVEHAPVMVFGGRLVAMWFMEPMFPAGINTHDAQGRLHSRYVHPGHLRALLPVEHDGEPWVVFGGANNVLDGPAAEREKRKRLNLPVVGAIQLGEDGFHPDLRRRVRELGVAFVSKALPYRVVDWDRNSQVVRLRIVDGEWLEATYEPGTDGSGVDHPDMGVYRTRLDSLWVRPDTL